MYFYVLFVEFFILIPVSFYAVENRKIFSDLADANVMEAGPHINGHDSRMTQSKSTGDGELLEAQGMCLSPYHIFLLIDCLYHIIRKSIE